MIYIELLDARQRDLSQILQRVRPSTVIDLRLAPHFDLAPLNRLSAFALFAALSIEYVDGALPLMAGKGKTSAMEGVREAARNATGPLVFLGSTEAGTLASVDEVRRIVFACQVDWVGPK